MLVYVLTHEAEYEGSYVLGVYTTEAKASLMMSTLTGRLGWFEVNSYELDKYETGLFL